MVNDCRSDVSTVNVSDSDSDSLTHTSPASHVWDIGKNSAGPDRTRRLIRVVTVC